MAYTYFHSEKGKFFVTDKTTLKVKGRKDINEMIAFLDGLKKLKAAKTPALSGRIKNLKRLKNAMNTYLFHMTRDCMNVLEWHEVEPGQNQYAGCPV